MGVFVRVSHEETSAQFAMTPFICSIHEWEDYYKPLETVIIFSERKIWPLKSHFIAMLAIFCSAFTWQRMRADFNENVY